MKEIEFNLSFASRYELNAFVMNIKKAKHLITEAEEINGPGSEKKLAARNEIRWLLREIMQQIGKIEDWSTPVLNFRFIEYEHLLNFLANIEEAEESIEDSRLIFGPNGDAHYALKALTWLSSEAGFGLINKE